MSITQLGYVGFGVSDMARWEDLATRIIGLQVSERAPDGSLYLRMDDHHHRVTLHPTGEDDLVYMGWQVPTPRALAEMEQRLRSAGVEVTRGSTEILAQRKVKGLIAFKDPSGLPFEVYYGPMVQPGQPFIPGRPITGFKAGPLGVGHLVMKVDDRDECERFYMDVLGLKLTDYGSGPLAFFHCNPRHHSIAVLNMSLRPSRERTLHLLLEYQSLDDVGTAWDLCQQSDIPPASTLGKHVNDEMVSFYFYTPSGFQIELGYGAVEVDDATWEVRSFDRGDVWGHQRIPSPSATQRETVASQRHG